MIHMDRGGGRNDSRDKRRESIFNLYHYPQSGDARRHVELLNWWQFPTMKAEGWPKLDSVRTVSEWPLW
jgi:hypothetical protein